MRIQETNKILKESVHARHAAHQPEEGMMARAWRTVSHLPQTITGFFRKH
jgi:hypothetical protein